MRSSIKYGAVIGIYYSVYNFLLFLIGFDPISGGSASVLSLFAIFIPFAGFPSCLYKIQETELDGEIDVRNAVKLGLTMTIAAGLITVIYNGIYYNILNPDFIINRIDTLTDKMLLEGSSSSEIQSMKDTTVKSFEGVLKYFSDAGSILFAGLMVSPIYGIIVAKDPEPKV